MISKETKQELIAIKEKILSSHRPLFLFDDDPDGLASFMLLYRMVNEGKGICLPSNQKFNDVMIENVNSFSPDLVIVLDRHDISQEFIDGVKAPIIWIDHHELKERHGLTYFNPRKYDKDDFRPTSYWSYRITEDDLWIAVAGIVADWFLPDKDMRKELEEKYPDLLPKEIKTAKDALFSTKIGTLARILSFNLKGGKAEVLKSMKVLTRINDPFEILNQTSPKGKFIFKKYNKLLTEYQALYNRVIIDKSPLIIFVYDDATTSYTVDLSNELLYKYPGKIVLVGRHSSKAYKCSLRSSEKSKVKAITLVETIMPSISGYGGGHENACGVYVEEDDFERFVELLKEEVSKSS